MAGRVKRARARRRGFIMKSKVNGLGAGSYSVSSGKVSGAIGESLRALAD